MQILSVVACASRVNFFYHNLLTLFSTYLSRMEHPLYLNLALSVLPKSWVKHTATDDALFHRESVAVLGKTVYTHVAAKYPWINDGGSIHKRQA